MGKFVITEEEKKEILGMYKPNNNDIQSQIDAELERLGHNVDDVEVIIDGESNDLNENIIKKAVVICSIVAGVVSCNKPDNKYIYKYTYETEGSQEYSKKHGYDMKTVNYHPYDHKLSDSEEDSIQDNLDSQKTSNGENVINSTFELYAIDTEGEWR